MAKIKSLLNDVEVNVDCLTFYPKDLVDKGQRALWVLQVETYKESDEWKNTEKNEWDYYEARRFNDNDRVVDVIFGCIKKSINKYITGSEMNQDDQQLVNDTFEFYINNLDENKLDEWINAALLYSAGCDHWYTFEKDWGE